MRALHGTERPKGRRYKLAKSVDFYTIFDPIVETEREVIGGPWCFIINSMKAYVAFPTKELAETFINRWHAPGDHEIIQLSTLGKDEHYELLKEVRYLLLLPSANDINTLLQDLENFPYQEFLIQREHQLIH